MIEMILTITLAGVLVDLIRTKRVARRYQEDLAYYKREFTALRLRNIASTSNTGRIPSAMPDDSLGGSVYRCNICGDHLWWSWTCRHWPGIVYRVEQDDGTVKKIRCAPIIENAEEKGRDQ